MTCDIDMSGKVSGVHLRPSLFPWVPPFIHFPKLRDDQEGQESRPTDSRVQIVWKVRQGRVTGRNSLSTSRQAREFGRQWATVWPTQDTPSQR